MEVRAIRFTNLCLTFLVALICLDEISLANALGKPTELRITSVHDLTITLTWKKPLSTSNTRLQYLVRYAAIGERSQALPYQTAKSAQLSLRADTNYNIHVKAIRSDDHQIHSDWESLQVDTSRDLVPAKPTNLRLISMTGLVARVAWDEPQRTVTGIPDTSSLNYKFSYKRLGGSKRQLRIASPPMTVSLVGNSQYEIKVVAFKSFNPRVSGPWSDILNIKTNEFAPSKPPTNVKVVSNTISSISVSWGAIPEEGRNGFILGFIVFYREKGAVSWSNRDVDLAYSIDLTGLAFGKTYEVKVAGKTKMGRGPSSPLQPIIVGGRFITTTKQTTTQKTTIPVTQELQTTSTKTPRTIPVQVDTTATESTKEPLDTTSRVFSQEPDRRTTIPYETGSKAEPSFYQSTPAVPLASKGDKESKPGFLNKILIIGISAAGGLLLLIILIAVFVSSRKRSRRRKRQNGEIPFETDNSRRQRSSRDAVTRGAFSIRYAPPGNDSMTQGLLEPSDEPVRVRIVLHGPNGTLLSEEAVSEDASLLGASCPEKCKLAVDLNTDKSKLTEGLYESIGSLGGAACETAEKNDDGARYVTHDQMAVTRDGALSAPTAQTSPHQCNGTVAGTTQQGNIYENLKDSEHLYDTLSLEGKNGPVYENTRVFPSLPESNRGKDEGYEPIPL